MCVIIYNESYFYWTYEDNSLIFLSYWLRIFVNTYISPMREDVATLLFCLRGSNISMYWYLSNEPINGESIFATKKQQYKICILRLQLSKWFWRHACESLH